MTPTHALLATRHTSPWRRRSERLVWPALAMTAMAAMAACSTAPQTGTTWRPAWLLSSDPADHRHAERPANTPLLWRMHASSALNADAQGHPLAMRVRTYQLQNTEAFLRAPLEAFGDPRKEKERFGEDLLSVREWQLLPEQRQEVTETLSSQARVVGVVALFRQAAPNRWRHAFVLGQQSTLSLHLGFHACAISVHQGEPWGMPMAVARAVAMRCP